MYRKPSWSRWGRNKREITIGVDWISSIGEETLQVVVDRGEEKSTSKERGQHSVVLLGKAGETGGTRWGEKGGKGVLT